VNVIYPLPASSYRINARDDRRDGTSEGEKCAVKSPPLVRRSRLKDGKLSPKWGWTGITMKFTFLLLRFVTPKQEPATVGFAQNQDTV
jgi:hypothetical protein